MMKTQVKHNAAPAPLLELRGISKSFPGVKALSDVALRLYPGEVHTLMGQNGAGKSTLIKVLTGVYTPDSGQILLDGKPIAPASTSDAQGLGISTVYQEVNLCPNLSVAENIFIGRYPRRFGAIDWRGMQQQARALLQQLQIDIDVTAQLSSFPLAIQQMVAISRALNISARVLILDEPTSSLDEAEVNLLFSVLRRLREQGMAILFVTHFLDQTYAISDRITVMRNGEREGEYACSELSRLALVNKMIGVAADTQEQTLDLAQDAGAASFGPTVLEAQGLGRKGALLPMDFHIRQGELLGLAGLLGSGRTELARLLFGADKADSGTITMQGQPRHFSVPRDAIARDIGFCSEDRKHEGAILSLSVRENIILALQARTGLLRAIPFKRQQALADEYVKALGIKTASIEAPIGSLSGGNQQKALLARWLVTSPAMLILDEPTRGIDVRAKQEIMSYVSKLCRKGMAILFISSELPEVLRCSDRIVVMRDRKGCGDYARGELDDSSVLQVIAGDAT
ncbi:sugar ABC transporter ATP-binding protein [Janthinobacterium lividum]|uniref:sugar ABC transporter ATP-binding protein n=1 Tax=Janthinobacterium lividum TaxID=29581 RepID=UPI000873A9ED|nr:sugar ABC transporter ATP-binding protein [Janthinobacterium lividum]OEZ53273.1 ribose import ATP-binding protein RbsA [Janthinobacterium lividum]WQE29264.1 sugar ABC transporter ATP-binding protein [Janthinobacterium lividum]STQ94738.1 Ribose import ATP-binding protein RbsA [Janthinobacterium lividum]